MPITGPASYLPTTEAFLNHWGSANAALPAATPLTIAGPPLGSAAPVTLGTLQGLYDQLVAQHAVVQTAVGDDDFAREDLFDQKKRMLDKLGQFNDKVRGNLPNTKYQRRLSEVPSLEDSRSIFTAAMETALNLWTRVNADEAMGVGLTLVLREDYLLASFAADVTALRGFYRTLGEMNDALGLERETRNDLQDQIYPILKQYRVLLPTFFAPTHALVATLPLLSPVSTGKTPAPVVATGTWDGAEAKAALAWAASTEPEVDHFEVRWSPGTEYHPDEESTLGTVSLQAARSFLTDQGLGTPGTKSLFRVYVVTKDGHEAGSETVTVARP